MARYEYVNVLDEKDKLEVERPMTDAPKVGHMLSHGGQTYVRVPSSGVQTTPVFSRRFMSNALPRYWPYAPRHVKSGRHKGKPLFDGQHEVNEALARANAHGERMVYDSDAGTDDDDLHTDDKR